MHTRDYIRVVLDKYAYSSTYSQYAGIYCLPLRPSPVPWSLKTSTRITSVGRCKQYMGSGAAYSGKRPRTSYSHCWFVSSPRPSLIKLLEQLQQQYAYHGALVVEVAYVRGIFHTYYQLVKIILLYQSMHTTSSYIAYLVHTTRVLQYSSTLSTLVVSIIYILRIIYYLLCTILQSMHTTSNVI